MISHSNLAPVSEKAKISLSSGSPEKDWKELAEQASHEADPQKLMKIVKDLCTALDAKPKRPASSPSPNPPADIAKERTGS